MPNWCSNKLRVYTTDDAVDARKFLADFVDKAKGVYPPEGAWPEQPLPEEEPKRDLLCFNSIVPLPADAFVQAYSPYGYEAERRLWGCKWGACDPITRDFEVGATDVDYEFKTPWSPPMPWIAAASKGWPGLIFDLRYEELDMDLFGRAVAWRGKIVRRIDWKPMGGSESFQWHG